MENTEQLASLLREEEKLQFSAFSNDTALEIGQMLVEAAKQAGWAVTIDITRNQQCLFHHAMTGTSIDNTEWLRRKNNVVNRFGHSSYYVGSYLRSLGQTMEEKYFISAREFASHGGAFPLIIKGVGAVGTISVSGLPQKDDHELVVKVLRLYLAKTLERF